MLTKGNGWAGSTAEGGEHRKRRGLEGVVNPLALVVVQLFVIEQLNLVFQQLRPQVLAVMHLLLSQQGNQPFPDRQQLLQRRFAILTWLADRPPPPEYFSDATRTMKNSSRLLLKMALNLA